MTRKNGQRAVQVVEMMGPGLKLILLVFALIGYGGTGASLAVARFRALDEGQADVGMLGVAAMLVLFGAVCTTVATGWLGVPALGGVAIWTSYIVMARQIGLFNIEVIPPVEPTPEPQPRSRA